MTYRIYSSSILTKSADNSSGFKDCTIVCHSLLIFLSTIITFCIRSTTNFNLDSNNGFFSKVCWSFLEYTVAWKIECKANISIRVTQDATRLRIERYKITSIAHHLTCEHVAGGKLSRTIDTGCRMTTVNWWFYSKGITKISRLFHIFNLYLPWLVHLEHLYVLTLSRVTHKNRFFSWQLAVVARLFYFAFAVNFFIISR